MDQVVKRGHAEVDEDANGKRNVTPNDLGEIVSAVKSSLASDISASISAKVNDTFSTAIRRVQKQKRVTFH